VTVNAKRYDRARVGHSMFESVSRMTMDRVFACLANKVGGV
jgi:hypothetical protein